MIRPEQGRLELKTVTNVNGINADSDGEKLRALGNAAIYDGSNVYADDTGNVYGRSKIHHAAPPIITADVIPLYSGGEDNNGNGYATKPGKYQAYAYAGKGEEGMDAMASDARDWAAASGVLDMCMSENHGLNAITAGSYAKLYPLDVKSAPTYTAYIELMTGDNRPPGVLIKRQVIEYEYYSDTMDNAKDFLSTGNVEHHTSHSSYVWNSDGRHDKNKPILHVTQSGSEADNQAVLTVGGQTSTIGVKQYAMKAVSELNAQFAKIHERDDPKGDWWAQGSPPPDYVADCTAVMTDARIDAAGNLTYIVKATASGECFPHVTFEADCLRITKHYKTDYTHKDSFEQLWWRDYRYTTDQTVTREQHKMSVWGGCPIKIAQVYLVQSGGAKLVQQVVTISHDGNYLARYDFTINEGTALGAGVFSEGNYKEIFWEYKHGLLDSVSQNDTIVTGPSYIINGLSDPEIIVYDAINATENNVRLSFGLYNGMTYQPDALGRTGEIYDANGRLVCKLPAQAGLDYKLAGVDAVDINPGVLICDGARTQTVYEVPVIKSGNSYSYREIKEFGSWRNYRLSYMPQTKLRHRS